MSALLRAEARRRRGDLEVERLFQEQRDAAGEILRHIGGRLKADPGPSGEELVHLARALTEAAGAQRLVAACLLGLYGSRLERELAANEDEPGEDTVH